MKPYITEAQRLQKLAGITEARVVPTGIGAYKYKIGETVRELLGDEETAKILDRRPNWKTVEDNPVNMDYLPRFMEHNDKIDNEPWYLVQWLEHNKDKRPVWWNEDELQPYINEARITPTSLSKPIKKEDLIKLLQDYYDYDPEFFEDIGVMSKDDIKQFTPLQLILNVIDLKLGDILIDQYKKYKKINVDHVDYTKEFLDHINTYTDINLDEARVMPGSQPKKSKKGEADFRYQNTLRIYFDDPVNNPDTEENMVDQKLYQLLNSVSLNNLDLELDWRDDSEVEIHNIDPQKFKEKFENPTEFMNRLSYIMEARVVSTSFTSLNTPLSLTKTDKNGNVFFNDDNIIKTIKKYKHLIARALDVKDINILNKFLIFYINELIDVEGWGDMLYYKNMTLKNFIDDLKFTYQSTNIDDWNRQDDDRISIKDIAELKNEARVVPANKNTGNKADFEYSKLVSGLISKAITKIILRDDYDIVTSLFNDDNLNPIIERYIKSKMIENNEEIVRGGVPDIITRANVNLLTDKEMLEYVEDNKEIKKYLERLYWKYYLELIDIDEINKIILDKYSDPYDSYPDLMEKNIYKDIEELYGSDIFPYTDDSFGRGADNGFDYYLQKELQKDIFEARIVSTSSTSLNTPLSLTKTDENGDIDFDYDNIIKTVKKYKYLIAKSLNIKDINTLNKFLVFYINGLEEIVHQGEQDFYVDMTLKDLIDDLKGVLQYDNDVSKWDISSDNDVVTVQDIAEMENEARVVPASMNPLFIKSGKFLDGKETYNVRFNNRDFEFAYNEYNDDYVCLENWSKDVALLNKYLQSKGVKTTIDIAPEKTIIIGADDIKKFMREARIVPGSS